MCFGGGDGGAAEARAAEERALAREAEREARIKTGQGNIDKAFKGYDDAYYKTYADSVRGAQQPQLQEKYDTSRGDLIAALAGRGTLESTSGAQQISQMGRLFADTSAQIQNEATDAASELRSRVENSKSDLYALNRASADPASISTQAIGQATALAAPKATTPVGDVFSGMLAPYMAMQNARNNSAGRGYVSNAPMARGSGSGRVIGG